MSQSIAYTSSSGMTFTPPTPPAGLTDVIIDLSSLSLPVATVDVYAAGLDPTDNAATFTYLWSVVSQPIGGWREIRAPSNASPLNTKATGFRSLTNRTRAR